MSIQYKRLGNHGLLVSNICLGTMNFGWHTDEKESFKIMDKALELGINFFDTADVYGRFINQPGLTEEIIGKWLSQDKKRREAIVLATKVYNTMDIKDDFQEINHISRSLSALKIKRHCEASLKRLQTDIIDLYQMHHIDRDCPWDEIWEAFSNLQVSGKIIYVGSSNFAGWDIAAACQTAYKMNKMGLASEQSVYNLSNRMIELEVIPACRYYGLGLIPYSPLAGGLLGGALEKSSSGRRSEAYISDKVEKNKDKLENYEALCRKIGESPANVAVAWLLNNPVVTSPIIGPRTAQQLEQMVQAASIKLDESVIKELDLIFPGPGGQAPNAYAW